MADLDVPVFTNDDNLSDLDDSEDREELRKRYYGLLQELRVVIPGVQVLLAFLLTAPFAARFEDLDDWGRRAYGLALVASLVSVVCLVTPTVLHRVGERTARADRLRFAIAASVGGLAALAVALLSALWCVTHVVFSVPVAVLIQAVAVMMIGGMWIVLPSLLRSNDPMRADDAPTAQG
jgi:hypothetical protein